MSIPKIIGARFDKIMVQITEPGIHPIMCRVVDMNKKTVSAQYQAKHLMISHDWYDYKGSISIDEILTYGGWND